MTGTESGTFSKQFANSFADYARKALEEQNAALSKRAAPEMSQTQEHPQVKEATNKNSNAREDALEAMNNPSKGPLNRDNSKPTQELC
jgi:hypothetical protein